jgi:hypothetical protein
MPLESPSHLLSWIVDKSYLRIGGRMWFLSMSGSCYDQQETKEEVKKGTSGRTLFTVSNVCTIEMVRYV